MPDVDDLSRSRGRTGDPFVTVSAATSVPLEAIRSTPTDPHFGGFESLRAVAATMVLLHHAGSLLGNRVGRLSELLAVFDGGVAVFFVLSGFLLYRPMVRRNLQGHPNAPWRRFWWRRVVRIVPAYWLALSVLWELGSFDLGREWWRYYLFLQIYRADTVLGGIVPAWSLCTELAYYLVLPVIAAAVAALAGLTRTPRSRRLVHVGACAALWIAGAASRWMFDNVWSSSRGLAFNWLPTNLDLFATGMLIAVVSAGWGSDTGFRQRLDRMATRVWPWWTPAVALYGWFAFRVGPTTFEAGYSGWYWQQRQLVLACFSALVLVPMVFGAQEVGVARRIWRVRPLVWVGTVSYGLYLWHLDLMEMAVEHGWLRITATPLGAVWRAPSAVARATWYAHVAPYVNLLVLGGVAMILALGCAAASWYGLERPLQRLRGAAGADRIVPTP